jgi:hypothetical protein
MAATVRRPVDGSTHWTARKPARHLGVGHVRVVRMRKRARLQPHRVARYMASNGPGLDEKPTDTIAPYVNPPEHPAVSSVDEKSAIQATDRTVSVLPMSPKRAERHGLLMRTACNPLAVCRLRHRVKSTTSGVTGTSNW